RLRIGLQLADRRGPLSEADFTMFVAAMQQLADELMAVVDMSPHQSLVDQAVEIDRFCADVDLEIGVHLVSRGTPFPGTKIRALAEAAGMTLGDDGMFTRRDDDGNAQFRLQNFESTPFSGESMKNLTTHGLTFLLDVPRVAHGERVFFVMVDLARRFADALQGQLVDDNRQPLVEAQLDRIKREYVVKTQAVMANFGLPAGSPQTLRLFS
ncbi:MAG: cell division protein ZipA C-terminal FtsZ-binding domain-containing protein, partial [Betaproteobacteria bacterium]